ncbi:hypothetical protein GCM10027568_10890 [Humibacter soli]
MANDEERWVTSEEVGAHLGISVKTVLNQARAGELPGTKVGRAWRFRLSTVDEFLTRPKDPWKQSNQSRGRKRAI